MELVLRGSGKSEVQDCVNDQEYRDDQTSRVTHGFSRDLAEPKDTEEERYVEGNKKGCGGVVWQAAKGEEKPPL